MKNAASTLDYRAYPQGAIRTMCSDHSFAVFIMTVNFLLVLCRLKLLSLLFFPPMPGVLGQVLAGHY